MNNIRKYNKIQEEVYREKLDNGLKVSICLKKGFKKFMVLFGTNFGAQINKFITDDNVVNEIPLGVAHFLEHKLFAMENGEDASNEFSKYGLDVNAYTDYTQTVYLFSGTSNLDIGINLLLDFVQKPYFTDESVEKEKGIIIQELKMYMDNPNSRLYNGLMKNLYKDFGYKYDVGGTIEEVQRTTKEDLYLCYNNYYHPSSMELLIIGDVDYEEVMDIIKANQNAKVFDKYKNPQMVYEKEDIYPEVSHLEEKMDVIIPKVSVGLKLPFHELKHNEVLLNEMIYKIVLEEYFGFQTAFYQDLIEKDIISNGLSYNVQLSNCCGFIFFKADSRKPHDFIKAIKKKVKELSKFNISNSSFNRMKKAVLGSLIKSLNSIEYIGYNYFDYNIKDSDIFEVVDILDNLKLEDLSILVSNIKEEYLSSYIINPKK